MLLEGVLSVPPTVVETLLGLPVAVFLARQLLSPLQVVVFSAPLLAVDVLANPLLVVDFSAHPLRLDVKLSKRK